jgi:lipoprotein-anchoring transpeptidase ErfK/SrfK
MQRWLRSFAVLLLVGAGLPAVTAGQDRASRGPEELPLVLELSNTRDTLPTWRARTDSIASLRAYRAAVRDRSTRVVVDVGAKRLHVLKGDDTLYKAPVAVGMGRLLEYGGRRWTFATPKGVRTVLGKVAEPKWRPPDWHYAETAREHGLKVANMLGTKPVVLRDGRRLVIRDRMAGLLLSDGFAPLPVDEHIVFDSTLYIPPLGTLNRRIDGELGAYQLDMGNGYLLHGTPRGESIGTATTHGCVRLLEQDIEWLYDNIPIGTKVYIY